MHQKLFEKLSVSTFLLQFYGHLSRGFFSDVEKKDIRQTIDQNIERLHLMKKIDWDGRYDLVLKLIAKTEELLNKAKSYNSFKQIGSDMDIVEFVKNSIDDFELTGIPLFELRTIFDISIPLKNGYMLHDSYSGYPEPNLYRYHIDCLDYLHSAAFFYNEGYEYLNNQKDIKYEIDFERLKLYEHKRIQSREERMLRNFREAYINLVFFMESFINSVGFNAFLDGLAKNELEENNLKGIESISKNGFKNFSNLKQRLKNIPKIISGSELDTMQEPFSSFLNYDVELRNKYVHSSPEKGSIQIQPEEWKMKCDNLIATDCFEILNGFWKSCYPSKTFPKVIFNTFWGNSFKGHQGKFMQLEK
jgi:hypothetical protein